MQLNNVLMLRGFRANICSINKISGSALFAASLVLAPGAANAAAAAATAIPAEAAATPATGGVFEKASAQEAKADPQFRSLFLSWKKLDQVGAQASVSIPSQKPVTSLSFTSNFGFRSDPFRGGRAMHAGVDIPGPVGTPIYATADGIVNRAQRLGGYGNYIEIEHGSGIQTRYGHLSEILIRPMTRVKRGDMIGRMGSTGRSTGSHLHYEVRLDGRAVNPLPFLQASDYLMAMKASDKPAGLAMGGPAK